METNNHGRTGHHAILQNKYIGDGNYYVRGIIKGIKVGDILNYNFTNSTVIEIISVKDSKAILTDDERKNALVEIIVHDNSFVINDEYLQKNNFGN